jgi:hypoxanthine-DNA glycosylase
MIEKHPYPPFIPLKTNYLLIGSFPGKQVDGNDWYYGSKRNQFWQILENVFHTQLKCIEDKKKLLTKLHLAVTDIILECERENNNNLDTNLKNLILNRKIITEILHKHKIKNIFFSSRFVEKIYRGKFKDLINMYPKINLVTLPSPSPRYAQLTKEQKIAKYKKLLPA